MHRKDDERSGVTAQLKSARPHHASALIATVEISSSSAHGATVRRLARAHAEAEFQRREDQLGGIKNAATVPADAADPGSQICVLSARQAQRSDLAVGSRLRQGDPVGRRRRFALANKDARPFVACGQEPGLRLHPCEHKAGTDPGTVGLTSRPNVMPDLKLRCVETG